MGVAWLGACAAKSAHVKHLTLNGRSYACPFADLLRPLTGQEWGNLSGAILEIEEILQPVQTYISERWGESILDGQHRGIIGTGFGLEIPLWCRGRMSEAKARVIALALNVPRRHLTPAEQEEAKGQRQAAVVVSQGEGKSTRTIAAEQGVSKTTVLNDLAAAKKQGGHPCPPATVTGSDGKEYPATKPPPKPPRTVRRLSIAERLRYHLQEAAKLLKQLTASESNRARAGELAEQHEIPILPGGRGCPWFAKLLAWCRDLAPAKRW